MFKELYRRYPYFFSLLAVLVLLILIRTLDWLAWSESSPENTRAILFKHLFEFIAFLPVILLMISCYQLAIRKKLKVLVLVFVILFAVLGPVLARYLSFLLATVFWDQEITSVTFDVLKKYVPGGSALVLFLSATFYLTYLRIQFNKQREAVHQAETLAKEVQLKMLYYQINPHFLFNVLNSIHALIDENTDKAKKLVVEMSEYYRSTLNTQQQTISIGKEVEAVVKYLEIQKTRFEEKFEYEIAVDEAMRGIQIPSFVIHLLIENAVKYGNKLNGQKLIIRLSVQLINQSLLIKVSNTGKLLESVSGSKNTSNGTGHGIDNIKNRLALIYDDQYSFSLTEEGGWVNAAIQIENIRTPR